ncbi:salicylate biosynthesis isochorismate synthase [bacterium BMS3Abin02]|nr:salicylate biosynthesis isochorismate synthase [bacterium BMS3Abin02]GBE22566.1 salicylate biosynthesis isochorismate synthase [bacterium BMS3Bbin01]HDK44659.1 isochorismate synthase [Actinomycetota bacterium]HDL49120.1 isochorismate synthase [Actinomycetota bacterium]
MLFPNDVATGLTAGLSVPCAVQPIDLARSASRAGFPVFYFGRREEAVGVGVAWRSDDLLARPPSEGRLFFAFPFDGSRRAGSVVLPAVTLVKGEAGGRLHVAPGQEEMPAMLSRLEHPGETPAPAGRVTARDPESDVWAAMVERARETIGSGLLSKVVLARSVTLAFDEVRPFDVVALLRERFPDAFTYGWAENGSAFVGASPELLVERRGESIRSFPLAGSAVRGSGSIDDAKSARALLGSAKDRSEHQFVVDEIVRLLRPLTSEMSVPTRPTVVRVANIQHLGTEIRGLLARPMGVVQLAMALHPTPAVCGTPTAAALSFIRDVETLDRGWYAGGVGWTDASGDGEAAVALRCALLQNHGARVYAGAGIVRDSDAAAEVAETEAKLRALLDILQTDPL